ncbi:MAG: Holliday junction branch migration protein RuvA [Saprospiraceae bacterium]|nr:Holliday junction branch migration protein RuvA [Saprospiraceae bacterium]MBP7680191.1 Holliday junction branch migration protein RuvA [Saprospiraceae bacterium]
MYSYIKGILTYKSPTHIVIENQGIGYHVNVTVTTFSQIESLTEAKIYTHLIVKEDAHTLYGFSDEQERNIFILLLSVSGVGANTARVVLSSMTVEDVRNAIVGDREDAFRKVKGIGIKTAKQIILDLKDKLVKTAGDANLTFFQQSNTLRDEALSALVALGFPKIAVQKTLNKLLQEHPNVASVEQLIKLALREMGN